MPPHRISPSPPLGNDLPCPEAARLHHPTLESGNSSCSCSAQCCLHQSQLHLPSLAQLQVGDKSPGVLEESVSPCAGCSKPSWATAPQAPPAPWDGTWGHQAQGNGHALGVRAAFCEKGRTGSCPGCLPSFVLLHGFMVEMFAGDVPPQLLKLVNGEQHVLGFASHLCFLQAALHVPYSQSQGTQGVPLCFVTSLWKALRTFSWQGQRY